MPEMSERERIKRSIEHLQLTTDEIRACDMPFIPNWNYDLLVDVILADRRRVLEPLLKEKERWVLRNGWSPDFYPNQTAIDATLKLAGLTTK